MRSAASSPPRILPFLDDLSIDGASFRRHLRDLASVRGVAAVTVNAHASEVASCTFQEQRAILAMALEHFCRIADATPLPLILFQYPLRGGLGYPLETLLELVDAVPTIRAIKDWCNDVPQHETHVRLLQSREPVVSVLSTYSAWLLSSLVLGCRGLLSGMGSVVADLQGALFEAVQAGDLRAAQALNARLKPLADVFYAEPFGDMHNRMKNALVLAGRIPGAAVRPPLVRLGQAEIEWIGRAMELAGLSPAREEFAPSLA